MLKTPHFDFSLYKLRDNSGQLNLLSIALPLFAQNVFASLLGTVNTIFMKDVSERAITASGVAGSALSVPLLLIDIIPTGLMILLSLALGRGDKQKAADITHTGLLTCIPFGLFLSAVLLLFTNPLIAFMGINGDTAKLAIQYFRIRAAGIVLLSVDHVASTLLRLNGRATDSMKSGILSNVLNTFLSFIFIRLCRYSESAVPYLALSCILSSCVGMAVSVFLLFKHCKGLFHGGRLVLRYCLKLFSVGIPGCLCRLVYSVSSTLTTKILAGLGESAINANVYFNTISGYTCLFGHALAQGNATLLGRYYGGKKYREVNTLFNENLLLVPLINCAIALALFIFSRQLMSLFTDDSTIITSAFWFFFIDIFIEISRGVNHISENSLVYIKDTVYTSVISAASCIGISLVLCYVLCLKTSLGIYGYFVASFAGETVKCVLFVIRFRIIMGRSIAGKRDVII